MLKIQNNIQTILYFVISCAVFLACKKNINKVTAVTTDVKTNDKFEMLKETVLTNEIDHVVKNENDHIVKNGTDIEEFKLIINEHCSMCHNNLKLLTNLDEWVKSGYLVPGSPEQSKVYNRLIFAPEGLGSPRDMPTDKLPIKMTSEDADKIYTFIKSLDFQEKNLEILDNYSAINKIKYILHGGSFSQEDINDINKLDEIMNSSEDEIKNSSKKEIIMNMIERWMNDGSSVDKLTNFFVISLQQNGSYDRERGFDTLFGRRIKVRDWNQNVFSMARRTIQNLIREDKSMIELLTTRKYYMTSALLATYFFIDDIKLAVVPTRIGDGKFSDFVSNNLKVSDFRDWRLIEINHDPQTQSMDYTDLEKIRAIKNNASITLKTPRIGFFTTLGFQLKWKTNDDNQFRVTTNQTLISTLNRAISSSDTSKVLSEESIDKEHASDEACYSCHRILDNIKGIFEKHYGYDYRSRNVRNSVNEVLNKKTGFYFMNDKNTPDNTKADDIFDLATRLVEHPLFAQSWVEKLCQYANSQECDISDPEFQKIVSNFKSSNFNIKNLIKDLFSSSIVIEQGDNSKKKYGPSIARRSHFCSALNHRYKDLIMRLGKTLSINNLCNINSVRRNIFGIPEMYASRGQTGLVMSSQHDPFIVKNKEVICEYLSPIVINEVPSSTEKEQKEFLNGIVEIFLNVHPSHKKYSEIYKIIEGHFNEVVTAKYPIKTAMEESFLLACSSLHLGAIGL